MKHFKKDPLAKRRIIWNLNHTTLMEWEVPQLIALGFEVFIPKILPDGPSGRTAVVTDRYDRTLSIPKNELDAINNVNFYDQPFPRGAVEIINQRFAYAICATIYPSLLYYTEQYRGVIFMRAFGHAGDHDYESATDTIDFSALASHENNDDLCIDSQDELPENDRIVHKNRATEALIRIRHRCYLSASYREIIAHEKKFLRSRSVYMPLALPPSILNHRDSWGGGDKRVLFVCPNIAQIGYYRAIYERFKRELGEFPHVIAGRQSLKGDKTEADIEDSTVTGYLTREQLDEQFRSCSCMFYHSEEKRHLHYHPLEAITFGMPLVYMAGGLLHSIAGDEQPGLCFSYEEARHKISRILADDEAFIEEIRFKQKEILAEFMPEYCDQTWKNYFSPLIRDCRTTKIGRGVIIRVLVYHPVYVLGGGIRVVQNLLNHLARFSRSGISFKLTLAVPREYIDKGFDFRGFSHRIEIVTLDNIDTRAARLRFDIVYFSWPHGVNAQDFGMPSVALYHDCIVLDKARLANDENLEYHAVQEIKSVIGITERMIVTSEYTKSRIGTVLSDEELKKVCVIPHMASERSDGSCSVTDPLPFLPSRYLYCPANLSPHKGHSELFMALSRLIEDDDFIPLVLTGYQTEFLQDLDACTSHENPYLAELADTVRKSGLVHGKHYYALGYLEEGDLKGVFRHCCALVSITRAEGMGLPVHEAIDLGKAVLLSDIAVYREHYEERLGLAFWIDPTSVESVHIGLADLRDTLSVSQDYHYPGSPTPHSWEDIAERTANVLRECLGME